MKKILLILILAALWPSVAYAADKSWNGQGDDTSWFDGANWLPSGVPGQSDDAKVDVSNATVEVGQALDAKSVTIGGKKESTVNVSNFVNATIAPADESNDAVTVRRGGKLVVKGSAGKVTLKGAYKDSEEIIPDEPSFMLYVK